MYGKWFLTVFGLAAVILLVVALMTAFSALIAVGVGLLLGFIVLLVLSTRRTRQVGAEHATAAAERRDAGQTERPTATGAPRSGEGDAGAAHRVRLRGGSG
jgi:MFS superfamily sulfate permease-like transporter